MSNIQSFQYTLNATISPGFLVRGVWWADRESNPDLQLRTLACCSVTPANFYAAVASAAALTESKKRKNSSTRVILSVL